MTTLAKSTVNERRAATGRMELWKYAVRSGDVEAMTALLRRIAVPDPRRVADALLADPAFYGFAAPVT